jgi:hypothetical protein
VLTLLLTLTSPQRAAQRIRTAAHWVPAFLLLAAISTICFGLIHPSLVQLTLDHLPPGATNADKLVVAERLEKELPTQLAFFPVRLFIGWSLFSLVLFSICKAFAPSAPIRPGQVLSIVVHAEVTSVIASLVTVVGVLLHVNSDPTATPLSLGAFAARDQSFVIKSLLTSLNIFMLWKIGILTAGISILSGFGRVRSLSVVLLVCTLSLLFTIGAMKVLQDQLHLPL